MLIAAAVVLAVVLLGAVGVLALGLVFGDEQKAQNEILETLGPPSRFMIAYLPRTEGGAQEVVRTEFWYYPDHQQRIAFVEGMIASVEDMEAEPEDASYLDVSPQDFDLTMGYDDVVSALGEEAEKVEDVPELEVGDEVEMYVTDHAIFAIERGGLVYLQTVGRVGDGATAGEDAQTAGGTSETLALYPICVGDKWGFMDADGKVVVQPRYASAEPLYDGFAVVGDGERYGYVDESGKLAIQPRFATAFGFHEGLAGASDGELFGFIDETGEWAIKPVFDYVGDFGDGGLAPFSNADGKWGYIDTGGKVVIPAQYEAADSFSGGYAAVRVGGAYGYIDETGATVIEPRLTSAGRFVDGLAPASTGDRIGFIDWKGNFPIEQVYLNAEPFSEGIAEVTTDAGSGFIDVEGKWSIEPAFEDAGPFRGGLAAVWVDGKLGYIDTKGDYVWEPGGAR